MKQEEIDNWIILLACEGIYDDIRKGYGAFSRPWLWDRLGIELSEKQKNMKKRRGL